MLLDELIKINTIENRPSPQTLGVQEKTFHVNFSDFFNNSE